MTATTFATLAEPTRLRILDLLRDRPRPVGELVDALGLSQPGVSKHLRVLRDARLVDVRPDAQRRIYHVRAQPLAEIDAWLEPYRQLFAGHLDALERHLDEQGAGAMTAADGTLETLDDGRSRLRFERRLSHPVDRVWAALTEPDEMRKWWAAADELDLREGGRFTIRWLNTDDEGNTAIARGTVSAVDPPRLLELDSDIHGVMRWELEPRGDATALTFTSTLELPDEYRDKVLAGWHAHLDFLEDALDGRPIEDWDNWPVEVWQKHNERYAAKVA